MRSALAIQFVVSLSLAAGCSPADSWKRPEGGQFDPIECPEVQGTAKSLREKAEYYDRVAQEWHVPGGQDLLFSVFLKVDLETFDLAVLSDNVGTWTALYSASQERGGRRFNLFSFARMELLPRTKALGNRLRSQVVG